MALIRKDVYFMRLAFEVAEASKCVRAKYGALVVAADGRILSTGYNGKPRGAANDEVCYREGLPANASKPNCCLHAEANALFFLGADRSVGTTVYVSGVPCTDCALLLQQAGIARLVYYADANPYGHKGDFDMEFYHKYGMRFETQPVYAQDLYDF